MWLLTCVARNWSKCGDRQDTAKGQSTAIRHVRTVKINRGGFCSAVIRFLLFHGPIRTFRYRSLVFLWHFAFERRRAPHHRAVDAVYILDLRLGKEEETIRSYVYISCCHGVAKKEEDGSRSSNS